MFVTHPFGLYCIYLPSVEGKTLPHSGTPTLKTNRKLLDQDGPALLKLSSICGCHIAEKVWWLSLSVELLSQTARPESLTGCPCISAISARWQSIFSTSLSPLELLSHLCFWAPIRVPQLPESPKGHLDRPIWGQRDSDELTAAVQASRLHTQHGTHVTVLPARSFIEHGVLEIFRGFWSVVAAKLSQTLVHCLGYFYPPLSCNQQSAITLLLTNHARKLSLCHHSLSLSLS